MYTTSATSDTTQRNVLGRPVRPDLIAAGPWWQNTLAPHRITASLLIGGRKTGELWQGPAVPRGPYLHAMGFDAVVLAAREHQPESKDLPGVYVVHCGYNDDPYGLTNREYLRVQRCARVTADLVRQGMRVLVTCAAGQNRSGLISGLAIRDLYGMAGHQAVELVKRQRPNALTNEAFATWLSRLPPPTARR